MLQGLYNLTSGVLTQNRNLNVVSNNMVNITSPGFKKDTMLSSNFKEEMLYRSSNKGKGEPREIGASSKIRTAQETRTNFEQGSFEETGNALDLALAGNGFFEIQGQAGMMYTRNGSFILDNEGYLSLPGAGRVMGQNGPILLNDDQVQIDFSGDITDRNGINLGKIRVVDFENVESLQKNKAGCFTGGNPQRIQGSMLQNTIEKSNVSVVNEMTAMMSSQRAIQSAAQVIKIYDQMLGKATTEIGRL